VKSAAFLLKVTVVAAVVLVGATQLGRREVRQLTEQVSRLETENARLSSFAQRLQASRRVAQVDVVKQYQDRDGRIASVLLWQEIGPDGLLGRPVAIETLGRQVYFEGWVIKFDYDRLAAADTGSTSGPGGGPGGDADPGRIDGASVVLFRRVFGEQQSPDSVPTFDCAPPMLSGGAATDEDARLWDLFWELTSQPDLATRYGVRVAQVEAPAVRISPGQVWEISLDAAGGLNLCKAGDRPGPPFGDEPLRTGDASQPSTSGPRAGDIDWRIVPPAGASAPGR